MVHCGYEPSAVNATFSSLGGFLATVKEIEAPQAQAEESRV
jgi:hypothetical protein